MLIKFNPTGTQIVKGRLVVRLDFYPSVNDKAYRYHYVSVPVIPPEGYLGKVDNRGNPLDDNTFNAWLESLPHVWRLNPCLCHFINVDEGIKLQKLRDFITQTFDKNILANISDAVILSNSAHLLHFMKAKSVQSSRKIITKDIVDLLGSVNNELKSTNIVLDSNGESNVLEPLSIDIGLPAIDRASVLSPNYTDIQNDNPAYATGYLDTIEVWFYADATAVKAGTFYGSGVTWTNRDYHLLGSVVGGSKQTFSSLSIEVTLGDLIGEYRETGGIETAGAGGGFGGTIEKAGDQFGAGVQTYTLYTGYGASIYGTGSEISAGYFPVIGGSHIIYTVGGDE